MSKLIKTIMLTDIVMDKFAGICSEQARLEMYETAYRYYDHELSARDLAEYINFVFGVYFYQEDIDRANKHYRISKQLMDGELPDEVFEEEL